MAKTLEIGVSNLLPEFLADALIFLGALQTAGAIAAGAFQALTDLFHHLLIIIESYSHRFTSLPFYYKPIVKCKCRVAKPGIRKTLLILQLS